jgi:hypothetical protein
VRLSCPNSADVPSSAGADLTSDPIFVVGVERSASAFSGSGFFSCSFLAAFPASAMAFAFAFANCVGDGGFALGAGLALLALFVCVFVGTGHLDDWEATEKENLLTRVDFHEGGM